MIGLYRGCTEVTSVTLFVFEGTICDIVFSLSMLLCFDKKKTTNCQGTVIG